MINNKSHPKYKIQIDLIKKEKVSKIRKIAKKK